MNRSLLESIGFRCTEHKIAIADNAMQFHIFEKDVSPDPGVYLFADDEHLKEKIDIFYVGKAGYGLARRLRQHEGGYIRKRKEDKKYISSVHSVLQKTGRNQASIWFRPSKDIRISDVIGGLTSEGVVSTYSVEEEALLTYFFESPEIHLYNASRPPLRTSHSVDEPKGSDEQPMEDHRKQTRKSSKKTDLEFYRLVDSQVQRNSSADQIANWKFAVSRWDDTVFDKFNATMKALQKDPVLEGCEASAVVYSGPPTSGRPILAFGKRGRERFLAHTNLYLFDLDLLHFIKLKYDRELKTKIVQKIVPLFDYFND